MSLRLEGRIATLVSLMIIRGHIVLATLVPSVDLQKLSEQADVVVAGRVGSVETADRTVRRRLTTRERDVGVRQATFIVEMVIKGQLDERQVVVEFLGLPKGREGVNGVIAMLQNLNPGERTVLLLNTNEQSAGTFIFVNDFKSAIRIADSATMTRLIAGRGTSGKPAEQIASLLTASLDSFSGGMLREALTDLVSLLGKTASQPIKTLLDRSTAPATRGACLETIIRLDDYSRLAQTVEFLWSGLESDVVLVNAKRGVSAAMALANDAKLVEKYYIPLLRHTCDFIRRDAAYAIRRAKIRSAVPMLIQGLEDSDSDTRYNCLMGLAETVGRTGDWAPSIGLFEKNEQDYVKRWQTWWSNVDRKEFMNHVERDPTR